MSSASADTLPRDAHDVVTSESGTYSKPHLTDDEFNKITVLIISPFNSPANLPDEEGDY